MDLIVEVTEAPTTEEVIDDTNSEDKTDNESTEEVVEVEGTDTQTENTGPLSVAFTRIETLATKVSTANQEVLSTKAELAEAKAEVSELNGKLSDATSQAGALKSMCSELIKVYEIRLGKPETDTSKASASDLLATYESYQKTFSEKFPDTQQSDTSEETHASTEDAGHSQPTRFPISKKR